MTSPLHVRISDTTLRDGEQAPGLAWTFQQKQRLLNALMAAGVDDAEIGMAAHYDVEKIFFRDAVLRFGKRTSLFCRANEKDIALAEKIGAGCIHISIPGSPIQHAALNLDGAGVMARLTSVVTSASGVCADVSVGIQDATRAPGYLIDELSALADQLGVFRLRLSDTVGISHPTAVTALVTRVARHYSGIIEFHGHNDLGLAVANSLAAIEGGAQSISVTVNGLGERAGNAALEQVVTGLRFALNRVCGIHSDQLSELCRLVAGMSGETVAPRAPVVGDRLFATESGMHCYGTENDPLAFAPFTPEMIGRRDRRACFIGKHSGAATVTAWALARQITMTRNEARSIARIARTMAGQLGRALASDEIMRLVANRTFY